MISIFSAVVAHFTVTDEWTYSFWSFLRYVVDDSERNVERRNGTEAAVVRQSSLSVINLEKFWVSYFSLALRIH